MQRSTKASRIPTSSIPASTSSSSLQQLGDDNKRHGLVQSEGDRFQSTTTTCTSKSCPLVQGQVSYPTVQRPVIEHRDHEFGMGHQDFSKMLPPTGGLQREPMRGGICFEKQMTSCIGAFGSHVKSLPTLQALPRVSNHLDSSQCWYQLLPKCSCVY